MIDGSARCMVCDGALSGLGRRGGSTYAACTSCGAVQLVPLPAEEELARLYREAYHAAGHCDTDPASGHRHRRNLSRHMARLLKALITPGDERIVVELGAGWGTLGLALREARIPYVGLEPSLPMCAHAESLGLRMRNGGIEELERDGELVRRLRAIVTMSVYEHLRDPQNVLRRMAALLPPDGLILIQCPTASVPRFVGRLMRRVAPGRELPCFFGFFSPPWHICFPTPASLRLQAARAGLAVKSIAASPSGRDPDWRRRWLQIVQEAIARGGHGLFGEGWPLSMSHVFWLRPKHTIATP